MINGGEGERDRDRDREVEKEIEGIEREEEYWRGIAHCLLSSYVSRILRYN